MISFLVEQEGYIVFIVDGALLIRQIETRKPLRDRFEPFLNRPLFDIAPELKTEKRALLDVFNRSNHFEIQSRRCSSLDRAKTWNITALPFRESPKQLLLLFKAAELSPAILQHQIEAEKKAKQKARRALHQARRAGATVLANISHEIRTPMNGIIGMSNLLLTTELSSEQREYTEIIRTSGEALLSVINDILNYSKIESDSVNVDKESFNLRHCIEECLDIHAERASKKNIELAYSLVHACPEKITTDKAKFTQILNNLISNAIKFTDTGHVVVRAKCRNKQSNSAQLYIEIEDTGIGIQRYAQQRIFKPFEQVGSSQNGRPGGTGLGLTISRRLVELLGGSLRVDSKLGHGSSLSLDLQIPRQRPKTVDTRTPSESILRNKRVLVVDDNATNRTILHEQLNLWGIQAVEAQDGDAALQRLSSNDNFDLAILDMHMPGLDGYELAKKIRQIRFYQDLPLVILTSLGWSKDRKLLQKLGINHYLRKPIKQSQLYNILFTIFSDAAGVRKALQSDTSLHNKTAQQWPLNILVAEDNKVNQRFIEQILQKLGYAPDIVPTGAMALEKIATKAFDLIFMDIEMPKMDGLETLKKIKKRLTKKKRPYIIALTAHAMPGDRDKFLKAGMDGYLSKPIEIAELVNIIKKFASKQKHQFNAADRHARNATDQPDDNDTITIQSIKESAGFAETDDDEIIKEIVITFLEETSELWEDIGNALHDRNFTHLYRAAHTIKSSSAIVGATRFSELAAKLADAADSNNLEKSNDIFQQLDAEKQRLFRILQHACEEIEV